MCSEGQTGVHLPKTYKNGSEDSRGQKNLGVGLGLRFLELRQRFGFRFHGIMWRSRHGLGLGLDKLVNCLFVIGGFHILRGKHFCNENVLVKFTLWHSRILVKKFTRQLSCGKTPKV